MKKVAIPVITNEGKYRLAFDVGIYCIDGSTTSLQYASKSAEEETGMGYSYGHKIGRVSVVIDKFKKDVRYMQGIMYNSEFTEEIERMVVNACIKAAEKYLLL